ncbi:N-acetylmuramoyl-L-alanine amidase [Bacillus thermotolerans]|uniref:N-acetylmuramoyl-L-alanine amidase n=1 Tax=Bacillus thermotolerans TaxID=1221996 RepID=A0A0F5HN73_BACTR|nr:N-acetylmuramoyl-L-alanine amidase [Bacillus thermotolerans]KKB34698.1 N-acetylmuramoyl-L-alanine amidase [Bacillus thermotolerans]KKB38787.1 N-acetylmuramoyl-L-alanine amidase [Bacillus thermotolerans]
MKRGLIFVVLACIMIIPLFRVNSIAQAAGFVDVPYRALKEVNYLADGRIANGSSSTIFASDKIVTREEAAVFIGRALQLDGKQRVTNFKDVGANNFSSGYIQSAVEKGILSGYEGGRFLPYNGVSRGEMAVMLSKAFGYEFGGTLSGAAKALTSRGIASGMEDGSFGADQFIKRVDFAIFLARAINPEFRTKEFSGFTKTIWTNVDNLNIRSGPSTSYASRGILAADTKIVGAHEVGGWTYVKTGSTVGFVSTYYLRDTEASESNVTPEPPVTGNVDLRLAGQTIIIDPGHGGSDPGASAFGLSEKTATLATGLKVNSLFKNTPFKIAMTRTGDTYPTLTQRTNFAKNNGGDVFVSIHANSASAAATGTETYYYSAAATNPYVADSKLLASKIQARMLTAWDLNNRGVKVGNFAVLRENNMPAALAELGFITNKGDNDKLKSDYWQTAAAKAIYLGILDYYKEKDYDVESLYSVAK